MNNVASVIRAPYDVLPSTCLTHCKKCIVYKLCSQPTHATAEISSNIYISILNRLVK